MFRGKKAENACVVHVLRRLKASLLKGCRDVSLSKVAASAFTMAEILLSLTIIGVVAAITLPSLTGNINERTWNTQRKALYSRMSQATLLLPQIRGYGVSSNTVNVDSNPSILFLTNGLSKVLKMNNICDANHVFDCGIPQSITMMNGSKFQLSSGINYMMDLYSMYSLAGSEQNSVIAAAFETANGENVLTYYYPKCKDLETALGANTSFSISEVMCANFVYDLNGKKGPNIVGKDVGFMTLFYPSNPVLVSPLPASASRRYSSSGQKLQSVCRALGDDFSAPNLEEMTSIVLNGELISKWFADGGGAATTTRATASQCGGKYWSFGGFVTMGCNGSGSGSGYCVKKF